ncbi:hypothetical protein Rrhod_1745 [Rhodococcus rhodnii LMG 5362]|uniref:Uncharacterized protein n=1 Tax=Rhodococcus rhodnii LMG 5362 TaxID=1273125 RepID=R7WNF2_9NOCA|nr:hypothetical protein Rrhod_1745 [Rhodococcus rhodnii LMG 5362]
MEVISLELFNHLFSFGSLVTFGDFVFQYAPIYIY